ncbi:MAG TPA: CoA ester lyase [Acidobacteriota bacterium]|nr:CoA ester lyase [Acidobacteriota bacterium]
MSHPRLTSLLFTPGTRPDRFVKVPTSGADGIIIDWEDAVPAADKDRVRGDTIAWLKQNGRVGTPPFVTAIRVNDLRSAPGRADLDALNAAAVRLDVVVIPKVESAAEVQAAARQLFGAPRLVCLIETVLGVRHAAEIATASPQVAALGFGGFDLSAETGGEPTWDALLWPRTQVVHAAVAAGVLAIDQPCIELENDAALAAECARVRALGFSGKLAIHPKQCGPIKVAFLPTAEQVEHARRLVTAFEAAHGHVAAIDGRMIDVPMYRSAQRLLARVSN